MTPEFRDTEAFYVLGTLTRVPKGAESVELFGGIWKDFEEALDRIEPESIEPDYLGISFAGEAEGEVNYIAGMVAGKLEEVPEGLVYVEIPAARHAIFTCPLSKVGTTYHHIFNEWLPGSDYELDHGSAVFERYPPEESGDMELAIHVPVTAG